MPNGASQLSSSSPADTYIAPDGSVYVRVSSAPLPPNSQRLTNGQQTASFNAIGSSGIANFMLGGGFQENALSWVNNFMGQQFSVTPTNFFDRSNSLSQANCPPPKATVGDERSQQAQSAQQTDNDISGPFQIVDEETAFRFFTQFQTKETLCEQLMQMTQYLRNVTNLYDSALMYECVAKYIDPLDQELEQMFLRSFALWQNLKFPDPRNTMPMPSPRSDCCYDLNILRLVTDDFRDHIVCNYASCKACNCDVCCSFHRLVMKCTALANNELHRQVCTFWKWQVGVLEDHIRSCGNKDKCSFCFPIKNLVDPLIQERGAVGSIRQFDAELGRRFNVARNEQQLQNIAKVLENEFFLRNGLISREIIHLRDCAKHQCEDVYMCHFLRTILNIHPLMCFGSDETSCAECQIFEIIDSRHEEKCKEKTHCGACRFLKKQKDNRNYLKMQLPPTGDVQPPKKSKRAVHTAAPNNDYPIVSIQKSLLKDYHFNWLYKDNKYAIGLQNPPECLIFMDYVQEKDPCPVCESKHYCTLCQLYLQRSLLAAQERITSYLIHSCDLTLFELLRCSSVDSIMKKCTKAQREDFERLKNMLFDGNKLPPAFWELIYKKNWVKSVEILEERMSRFVYLPSPFDTKAKPKKKPVKAEAQKKKELKLFHKKDGKIMFSLDAQCTQCNYDYCCDSCTEMLHACARDAQVLMAKVFKYYNAFPDMNKPQKKLLSIVSLFRPLDPETQEMIGKRIAKMLEGCGEENIPVRFLDVWINTVKDPEKYNGKKAGYLWQELFQACHGYSRSYDSFFCNRPLNRDIPLNLRTAPPGTTRERITRTYYHCDDELSEVTSKAMVAKGSPGRRTKTPAETRAMFAEMLLSPSSDDEEIPEEFRNPKNPCPNCPPNNYCKPCFEIKRDQINESRKFAECMVDLEKKYGFKYTKNDLLANANEEAKVALEKMRVGWMDYGGPTSSQDICEFLEELSVWDWKTFLEHCDVVLKQLERGERIMFENLFAETGKIYQDDHHEASKPSQHHNSKTIVPTPQCNTVATTQKPKPTGPALTTVATNRKLENEVPSTSGVSSGVSPLENGGPTKDIGTQTTIPEKKKKKDLYPTKNEDGYKIEWHDGVPVVILPIHETRRIREDNRSTEKSKIFQAEVQEEETTVEEEKKSPMIKSQELAAHVFQCVNTGSCEQCREFYIPNILHYRNCRTENCTTCNSAQKELPQLYNHSKNATDPQGALEAIEKDLKTMKPEEEDDNLLNYVVQQPIGSNEPILKFACILPENFRMDAICYRTFDIHPGMDNVRRFFFNHATNCQIQYKENCTMCSLILGAFRWFNHSSTTCTLQKGFCYECDAYLEAQYRHFDECCDCEYCQIVKKCLGADDFNKIVAATRRRSENFAQRIYPPTRTMRHKCGDKFEGFSFHRLREEQEEINAHVQWCLNRNCELCFIEYSVDRFLEHLHKCPQYFDLNCEICVKFGGNVANHILTCTQSDCQFCKPIRRVEPSFNLKYHKRKFQEQLARGNEVPVRYEPPIPDDIMIYFDETLKQDLITLYDGIHSLCYDYKGMFFAINPFGLKKSQQIKMGHNYVFAIEEDFWRFNIDHIRPQRTCANKWTAFYKAICLLKEEAGVLDLTASPEYDTVLYHEELLYINLPLVEFTSTMIAPYTDEWFPFSAEESALMVEHAANCTTQDCMECIKIAGFNEHVCCCLLMNPWMCDRCSHFFYARMDHMRSCQNKNCRFCLVLHQCFGQDMAHRMKTEMPRPDNFSRVYTLIQNGDPIMSSQDEQDDDNEESEKENQASQLYI